MAAKKKSTSAKGKKTTGKKVAKSKKAAAKSRSASGRTPSRGKASTAGKTSGTKTGRSSRSGKKTDRAKTKAAKATTRKTNGKKTSAAGQTKVAGAPARKSAAGGSNNNPRKAALHDDAPNLDVKPPRPPKKTWLSKEDLDFFDNLLLEKRAELVDDVMGLSNEALRKNRSESAGDVSSMPTHMADLGSDNWEQEFTLSLIEKDRTLLREIDEALERIRDRTYGICLGSNARISKTRLKAKPWAKYCIEYARKKELGLVR